MPEKKVSLEGVEVTLKLPDDVKLKGVRGGICRFTCRCGKEHIFIKRDDLGRGERTATFHAVRRDVELTKEWNKLQERAKGRKLDFIDYEGEMGLWAEKQRVGEGLTMARNETSITVSCPLCHRRYRIGVTLENPLRAETSMDPIEAFNHLGIDEARHTAELSKTGFECGFEAGKAFLEYLRNLSVERGQIETLCHQLSETVDDALGEELRTDLTESQLKQLKSRLYDFADSYARKNERQLLRCLGAFRPSSVASVSGH